MVLVLAGFAVWQYPAFFSKDQMASIISPISGESFSQDQTVTIRWTPGSPGIQQITLIPKAAFDQYYPQYGLNWYYEGAITIYYKQEYAYTSGDGDTSGLYMFTPSAKNVPVGSYYIRIDQARNASISDVSSKPIQIIASGQNTVPSLPSALPAPSSYQSLLTSNHRVENIMTSSAGVKIDSTIPAIMNIEYKANADYNSWYATKSDRISTPWESVYTMTHSITLNNLAPGTQYFYAINMKSQSGLTLSAGPLAFTTLPEAKSLVTPPPLPPPPVTSVPKKPIMVSPVPVTSKTGPSAPSSPAIGSDEPDVAKDVKTAEIPAAPGSGPEARKGFVSRIWEGFKNVISSIFGF